jgi:hypothetical protein
VERVSENGLWVDTARHTGPLVIMQPDQTGIVLRRTSVESTDVEDSTQEQASPLQQSDVWIGLVFLRPLALPVQAEIRSNVEEWVKEYLDRTGDEWLFDLVRDRLLRADTLDHVVAIGIMARLQRPPSGQELKNALDAMLRGESVGPGQREQQWARQLNREELRSVERLAVAEAELLDEELESLGSSALVDEPEWQADMLDVLHLRDDLEGVWLLLRSGGGGDVLEGLLESIDEQGRLCIKALPIWQGPESDQRLQRAAVVNPEGWWTWPTDWDL